MASGDRQPQEVTGGVDLDTLQRHLDQYPPPFRQVASKSEPGLPHMIGLGNKHGNYVTEYGPLEAMLAVYNYLPAIINEIRELRKLRDNNQTPVTTEEPGKASAGPYTVLVVKVYLTSTCKDMLPIPVRRIGDNGEFEFLQSGEMSVLVDQANIAADLARQLAAVREERDRYLAICTEVLNLIDFEFVIFDKYSTDDQVEYKAGLRRWEALQQKLGQLSTVPGSMPIIPSPS